MLKVLSGIGLVVLVLGFPQIALADGNKNGIHDEGSFYAFWGWNRGYYSDSDVRFQGENYDFTIKDMSASDRPTAIGIDPYLNPFNITLPQTNFKIGYFFKDNYAISFGVDHMKYVMDQEQTAIIDGYINVGSQHDGNYDSQAVYLGQVDENEELTFLAYEHTDGLNYINVEINRFDEMHAFSPQFKVSTILGAGVGFMLPKTNSTLLENERYDDFHVSGWGVNVKGGIEFSYNAYFFRSELKYGLIDMADIRTTQLETDKASQDFMFTEWNFLFGRYF